MMFTKLPLVCSGLCCYLVQVGRKEAEDVCERLNQVDLHQEILSVSHAVIGISKIVSPFAVQ
jgi:hypothetical protein